MSSHVLTDLVKRRIELASEAKTADAALTRLLADIEHIDGAIRVYDPAYRAKKVNCTRAPRADLTKGALDVLRQARAPMSLREITLAIMARHGKPQTDGKAVTAQINRVRAALHRQAKNGAVRQSRGDGVAMVWEVARR